MELPEDIDKIATEIVRRPYDSEDEPDFAMYLAIGRAIFAERQKRIGIVHLDWSDDAQHGICAEYAGFWYWVRGDASRYAVLFGPTQNEYLPGTHESVAEAQKAAQADFERRINSAITLQTPVEA